ncbi:TPA: hypothetical protein RJR42_003709 [Burkholderia cepacia]|nr:hypothetical protein [Burkholderia cepacia]
MLRRDEQRWHRTLADAQIVTECYTATIWPGHRNSRADTLNLADRLAQRTEHIVILMRDVPAVEREWCLISVAWSFFQLADTESLRT